MEEIQGWSDAGEYTSLTLDSSGNPHVSYYSYGTGDLLYAKAGVLEMTLSANIEAGQLMLTWPMLSGAAATYWVYGASNDAFFEPGFAPGYEHLLDQIDPQTAIWYSSKGVGDPTHNWSYLVMAVDEMETEFARSNRVGEHDSEGDIPE